MGIFSKSKKTEPSEVFRLMKTDMHSHLIPGVDDGSPDLATSLKLISGLHALGFSKLITTPHIMQDIYKNEAATILIRLDMVREALQKEGIPVDLHAAAEYFLDDHVAGLLKENKPLLTISGNMVLCEFSLAYKPHGIAEILFEMQMQGYQPVIAHPERYTYLQQNRDYYDELKDIGCLFQLNVLSLGGGYGRTVQELAQYLVKKDFYDLLGTDLHHGGHLEALKNPGLLQNLKKMLDTGRFRNSSL